MLRWLRERREARAEVPAQAADRLWDQDGDPVFVMLCHEGCGREAEWVRRTQFAGSHFFCRPHAEAEANFGLEDPSYFVWERLPEREKSTELEWLAPVIEVGERRFPAFEALFGEPVAGTYLIRDWYVGLELSEEAAWTDQLRISEENPRMIQFRESPNRAAILWPREDGRRSNIPERVARALGEALGCQWVLDERRLLPSEQYLSVWRVV